MQPTRWSVTSVGYDKVDGLLRACGVCSQMFIILCFICDRASHDTPRAQGAVAKKSYNNLAGKNVLCALNMVSKIWTCARPSVDSYRKLQNGELFLVSIYHNFYLGIWPVMRQTKFSSSGASMGQLKRSALAVIVFS